jgi:hypothetical protein
MYLAGQTSQLRFPQDLLWPEGKPELPQSGGGVHKMGGDEVMGSPLWRHSEL